MCIAPDAAMAPKMQELMAIMQGDLQAHVAMKRPAGAGASGASKKPRAEDAVVEPPLKKRAAGGDCGKGWGGGCLVVVSDVRPLPECSVCPLVQRPCCATP